MVSGHRPEPGVPAYHSLKMRLLELGTSLRYRQIHPRNKRWHWETVAMRIAPLRFQIRTILIAIAALAALLALGLQLGTLSEEARRGRLQRQVEKNQKIIDKNQQTIDKNQQIIDSNRQEMERTQQVLEKNRAEIERMQRQLQEMNRASTKNQQPKDG